MATAKYPPNPITTSGSGVAANLQYMVALLAVGVDLKNLGQTVIVPVKTGKRFIPRAIFLRITASTALTVAPIVRAGNNGSFNNVAALTTLTSAATEMIMPLTLVTGTSLVTIDLGTTAISLDVQTAATATTLTADVYGEGYII